MNLAIFLGLGIGFGALTMLSGLVPARAPLAVALDRLHQPRPSNRNDSVDTTLLVRLVGRPLARSDAGKHLAGRVTRDLRITAKSSEELLAKMVLCALVGLLWAPATVLLMQSGGVSVSLALPVWSSIVLAFAGFVVPWLGVRMSASERRRAFRHALGCFLDLVAVRLAGGAGVESALNLSAANGQGWVFGELRHALAEARLMGEPPWVGLDRLGTELGISELNELAASVTLAGAEGARVRSSIAAKARAIRLRGLADAESAAQAASERMSLPIVLLMVGFVVFLGYPAVMQVLTGL